jgi:hypothetical protein
MTWLFVRISPVAVSTMPVPAPSACWYANVLTMSTRAGSMIAAIDEVSVADPDDVPEAVGTEFGTTDGSVVALELGWDVACTVGTLAPVVTYRPTSAPATPTANAAMSPNATKTPVRRLFLRGGGGGAVVVNV